MDNADDLPISIPLSAVVDHINCPICMCEMTDTAITKCGHRFCHKCVSECIDRHHKCPCCNEKLQVADLIQDKQFDNLITNIRAAQSVAEKTYFNTLISTAMEWQDSSAGAERAALPSDRSDVTKKSPIETVLQTHLRSSLAAHQKFLKDLETACRRQKLYYESDYKRKKTELELKPGLSEEEVNARLQGLEAEKQGKMSDADSHCQKCVELLAAAYDKYLTEHIPDLTILPVTVGVYVLDKSFHLPDVVLKPTDNVTCLSDVISTHMAALGDPVVEMTDLKFFCVGPFFRYTVYEFRDIVQAIVTRGATNPEVMEMSPDLPVLQYHMKPGSSVLVYGTIKLKSDLPKLCVRMTFSKDDPQTIDYFTCTDCNTNWICRPCSESCHATHTVTPYIMNHRPSWNCCYCPKKCACLIQG